MVVLGKDILSALEIACLDAFPREVCGALLGIKDAGRILVRDAFLGGSGSLGSFEIPDFELRRMAAIGAARGLEIVALFHAHPSGVPALSDTDRLMLRHSSWPWIVLTRCGGLLSVSAYRLGDCSPLPVEIVAHEIGPALGSSLEDQHHESGE